MLQKRMRPTSVCKYMPPAIQKRMRPTNACKYTLHQMED
jgi:hypothetical protein